MSAFFRANKIALLTGAVALSFLCACGRNDEKELVPPQDMTYTSAEKETTTVKKGDMTYAFEHEALLAGYDEIEYRITNEKLAEMENVYDMKLDQVNVTLGDRVKAGQTLVSFSSKELDEELRSRKQNKELAQLKLDHIARLSQLDPTKDHTEQIKLLENECRVADLYVSDIQSVYSNFNLISEIDGIVSEMDPSLNGGVIATGKVLLRVVKFDGYYEMDLGTGEKIAGTTTDDFVPGDIYQAEGNRSAYELEVIAPPAGREEEANMVFFKPVNDTGEFLGRTLTIVGKPKTISNICHVDKKAIIESGEDTYVLKKREDGEFEAVKVVVGDTIGYEAVIKQGLSGGEEVMLPQ